MGPYMRFGIFIGLLVIAYAFITGFLLILTDLISQRW